MKRALQQIDRYRAARRTAKAKRHRSLMADLEALRRAKANHERAERMRTAGKPFLMPRPFEANLPMSMEAMERLVARSEPRQMVYRFNPFGL